MILHEYTGRVKEKPTCRELFIPNPKQLLFFESSISWGGTEIRSNTNMEEDYILVKETLEEIQELMLKEVVPQIGQVIRKPSAVGWSETLSPKPGEG